MIEDSKPWTGPNRRVQRICDDRIDRVYRAYRLLDAYANPLRTGLPLSKTELAGVGQARKILKGASA